MGGRDRESLLFSHRHKNTTNLIKRNEDDSIKKEQILGAGYKETRKKKLSTPFSYILFFIRTSYWYVGGEGSCARPDQNHNKYECSFFVSHKKSL